MCFFKKISLSLDIWQIQSTPTGNHPKDPEPVPCSNLGHTCLLDKHIVTQTKTRLLFSPTQSKVNQDDFLPMSKRYLQQGCPWLCTHALLQFFRESWQIVNHFFVNLKVFQKSFRRILLVQINFLKFKSIPKFGHDYFFRYKIEVLFLPTLWIHPFAMCLSSVHFLYEERLSFFPLRRFLISGESKKVVGWPTWELRCRWRW